MLTKIVLINASSYALAELDFEGSSSLQLVGPNNVGKSSLIYSLNFLFLINKRLMSFSGQRPADKETLLHYFPDPERSYIVFEVKKRKKRYCILVRRDAEGDLHYAKMDKGYRRDLFFLEKDGKHQLRSYRELLTWLNARQGIRLRDLPQQQDVLREIYQIGKNNDAAVWLTNRCKTIGQTNSFSKVYRYLINSKLITNNALKEILLIADNRDQDALNYNRQNIQNIDRLRRQSQQVNILRNIAEEFQRFRELVVDTQGLHESLLHSVAVYHAAAQRKMADLLEREARKKKEILRLQDDLQEKDVLNRQYNRRIGELESERRRLQQQYDQLDHRRLRILDMPAKELLEQQLENKDASVNRLNFRIQELAASAGKKAGDLEARIDRLNRRIDRLERQKADIDDWLVHHLTDCEAGKRLLNSILSPELARLPHKHIRRAIDEVSPLIALFDGEIELPEDFPLKELATPDQLTEELTELQRERDRFIQLWETARNQESLKEEQTVLQRERRQLIDQLREAEELKVVERDLTATQRELTGLETKEAEEEQKLKVLEEEIRRIRSGIQTLTEDISQIDRERKELERDRRDLESLQMHAANLDKIDENFRRDPADLFREIKTLHQQYLQKREAKSRQFQHLKTRTYYDTADEREFIRMLEQELASLKDKERSIDGLLENIAVQFANPARKFLDAYLEFQIFIKKEFNHKLSQIRISNIESLHVELAPNEKLQRDLQGIAELSVNAQNLFSMEQSADERFQVLRDYLEKGRTIEFAELFDLRLRLVVNGKARSVNLARQVESDGTDRMLRLIIIITVINRLAFRDPGNRIVLFIDEIATIDGKNRPQLVAFCEENHFFPIFAAPDIVEGFDRYVLIRRQEGGKIVIDREKHVIHVERETPAPLVQER